MICVSFHCYYIDILKRCQYISKASPKSIIDIFYCQCYYNYKSDATSIDGCPLANSLLKNNRSVCRTWRLFFMCNLINQTYNSNDQYSKLKQPIICNHGHPPLSLDWRA